ncbi:MAG: glycoside hydrolase family 31 protein [Candidatus Didemnitutus sp.]|nr:glycoside hydrolase family 31 protein [Candidatus Didemnitutus sp.]
MRLLVCALASSLLLSHTVILAADSTALQPIAAVASTTRTAQGVTLTAADGSTVAVSVLAPDLVRVRTLFAGQKPALDHSWAVAKTDWPAVPFQFSEDSASVTLATAELKVVIQRDPLLIEFRDAATGRVLNADARPMARDPKTGAVGTAKKLGYEEHFYGLGEKAARLDRRRGKFVMWTSDTPGYVEGTDPIYQSIPFYVGLEAGVAYGLFYDNAWRSTFEFGHLTQESANYTADGGELNYYFFAGPSLKKIVSRYTELTGRMPLPPLWSLGHQQSRYSYYPDKLVEHIADQYRAHDLPLDVLYLDIHYMDGYRVFTWDKSRFPDPAAMTRRLAEQGIRVVTIIDPGVKYQPEGGYAPYDEGLKNDFFLKQTDGSVYIGEVWPGKAVFVDYTKEAARRWWGEQHRALTDVGIAGIWTDMNEPADFLDPSGKRHENIRFDDLGQHTPYNGMRNTFALNMTRATYEGLQRLKPNERPFVITRAGYAGIQRYAVKWTGDNNATFASLSLNVPMFASLGLSGEPFIGADIPGFIGRGDGELLARSYQIAAFSPFFRNHTAIDGYDKEPWRFGRYYEDIARKFIKLRYALLPFIYTTMEEASRTGVPLFRPLVLNFQADENTATIDDQFMVGDALLAAPVTRAAQREREIYFPAGIWFDYWTGKQVVSENVGASLLATGSEKSRASSLPQGETRVVAVPLDHLPLYVHGGSIVPSTVAMSHTGEKPWNPLRFDVYPDAQGGATGSLYEDDGLSPAYQKGALRRTTLMFANRKLTLSAEGAFQPAAREFEVVVHGVTAGAVFVDGQALSADAWSRGTNDSVSLRLPDTGKTRVVEFR